ncbi:type II secretion system F family protein [Puerhibacterium puerhi]|uniref:type II secretion system F family protein n=1 Tax=Puerhibacterium puerhi TaxID=2692623 RepID=UPI001F1B831F|nr:type II secretion system F family protein [Puerhibacterium puerhi]
MTAAGAVVGLLVLAACAPWAAAERAAHRRSRALAAEVRAPVEPRGPRVDVPVVLELLGAALRAGAGVPRALQTVGGAVGDDDGRSLGRVADALRLGAPWDAAWRDAPERLGTVHRALRPAWVDGAAPGESLRAAGEELRRERRNAARTAAARLGVRLVLPLGACYLPAFVLVGLAPVLLALGIDLLSG